MAFKPQYKVWAYVGLETVSFETAVVERVEAHKGLITVRLNSNKSLLELKEEHVHRANPPGQDSVPDNTFMRELNEATLLNNLRSRYNSKDDGGCYSATGHILVAVNPFRELKIYDDKQIKRYLNRPIGGEPPHIYAIADRMYRLIVATGDSQAIVVSGPSGSGKTETCKLVLRHLAYVTKDSTAAGMSKSSMELGALLVQTNPLLEAFGKRQGCGAYKGPCRE